MSWRDWPGVKASAFSSGVSTHYTRKIRRRRLPGEEDPEPMMRVAACGQGSRLTEDPRRVDCLRCFRTAHYQRDATALLREEKIARGDPPQDGTSDES